MFSRVLEGVEPLLRAVVVRLEAFRWRGGLFSVVRGLRPTLELIQVLLESHFPLNLSPVAKFEREITRQNRTFLLYRPSRQQH